MTRFHAAIGIAALTAVVGCGSNGPYEVGLIVKSASEVESITKTYREVSGKGVQESSGVLGTGEACSEAMSSAGNRVTQWVGEDRINVQVVGETVVPVLVPDDSHEQEEVWVSLVMETTRSAGTAYTSEKRNFPGEDPAETTTAALEDRPVSTSVRYFGVTAEDYVAAFQLASLWPTGGDGLNASDAQMLTKNDPKKGDVWFSQNGNSVYMFAGFEDLTVSGEKLKVARVNVYESADVAVADDGIMELCINVGRDQLASPDAGVSYDDEVTLLDAGCENNFRHTQTGSQWWSDGILVKEETESVDVTIVDYGWEWYEDAGGLCRRQTSTNRPNSQAEMYLEYEVTTSTISRLASDWIPAP